MSDQIIFLEKAKIDFQNFRENFVKGYKESFLEVYTFCKGNLKVQFEHTTGLSTADPVVLEKYQNLV